jgi:L-2-hydroxyglutarate oxidase LhgO
MAREVYIKEKAGSLLVEREAVIDPFSICSAFSENSKHNGTDFFLGYAPLTIERNNYGFECQLQSQGTQLDVILEKGLTVSNNQWDRRYSLCGASMLSMPLV